MNSPTYPPQSQPPTHWPPLQPSAPPLSLPPGPPPQQAGYPGPAHPSSFSGSYPRPPSQVLPNPIGAANTSHPGSIQTSKLSSPTSGSRQALVAEVFLPIISPFKPIVSDIQRIVPRSPQTASSFTSLLANMPNSRLVEETSNHPRMKSPT